MLTRRKLLFAILEKWGGEIDKISFQKLLFLLNINKATPLYEFIPYKFGCYSFTLSYDLDLYIKEGQIEEKEKSIVKKTPLKYTNLLEPSLKKEIDYLYLLFKDKSSKDLINYTYKKYPYYATKSTIAKDVLSSLEYNKLPLFLEPDNKSDLTLYTIGYESNSIEAYFNKLIKNNIKVLIDVRNNPLSMKYGFSKSHLKKYCDYLSIKYLHFPELGIHSSARKTLSDQNSYNLLFDTYKKSILPATTNYQLELISVLSENKKVAITCFEKDICQCHRKPLSENIKKISKLPITIKHI